MLLQTDERIAALLSQFKLPTLCAELTKRIRQSGHDAALSVLLELFEMEAADRHGRRIQRLRHASKLPASKTYETLDESRIPQPLLTSLRKLNTGEFLERADNILCFGLPGVGKTHAACALGHALISTGHSVFFSPTYEIVQDLLAAKRDLVLPRRLRQLDAFELLILDDIGYVQQTSEEAEILFTLMAERYERKSLLLTSNLVFSQWDRIFKNPMTTAAAIDRLVHHSAILEFDVPSFRTESAKKRVSLPQVTPPAIT